MVNNSVGTMFMCDYNFQKTNMTFVGRNKMRCMIDSYNIGKFQIVSDTK